MPVVNFSAETIGGYDPLTDAPTLLGTTGGWSIGVLATPDAVVEREASPSSLVYVENETYINGGAIYQTHSDTLSASDVTISSNYDDWDEDSFGFAITGTVTYPDTEAWRGKTIFVWRSVGAGLDFYSVAFTVKPLNFINVVSPYSGYYLAAERSGRDYSISVSAKAWHYPPLTFFETFTEDPATGATLFAEINGDEIEVELTESVGVWSGVLEFTTEGVSGTPWRYKVVDNYGQSSSWFYDCFPPVARLRLVSSNSPFFTVEDDGSFDPDGNIESWTPDVSDSQQYTFDLTSVAEALESNYENYPLSLVLVDDDANYSYTDVDTLYVTVEPIGTIGTVTDNQGGFASAVRTGANVQVYRFGSDAERTTVALISGASQPCLWRIDTSDLGMALAYRNTDGDFVIVQSHDGGRSFE